MILFSCFRTCSRVTVVFFDIVLIRDDRNPCFHDDIVANSFLCDTRSCGSKRPLCLFAELLPRIRE
jgi:hypothetical protein